MAATDDALRAPAAVGGRTADVIIVGGGVIGCAAAYYLARAGVAVTVLERDESMGSGASSRNGGGVRQSGRDPRELPLARYAVEHLWPGLAEELGYDVEYVQKGNLRLGKTPEHLAILERLTASANELGIGMEMLDAAGVRAINPFLSDEVIGASWCPTDGHANPLRTTLAFYQAARKLGARFLTGVSVRGLRKRHGRVHDVETSAGTFAADTVIVAAGLGSRAIAATVDIDIPMRGRLIECLVTEAQPPMFPQMLGTAAADFYGHQTKHGSFVFGGSSGLEIANGAFGGMPSSSLTASAQCRAVMGYVPRLARAKVVRTWAGWEDACVDKVPVISAVDEVPGLIIACAFTGHGFGISPIVGLLLSELAQGLPTTLDVSAFRYDRFRPRI